MYVYVYLYLCVIVCYQHHSEIIQILLSHFTLDSNFIFSLLNSWTFCVLWPYFESQNEYINQVLSHSILSALLFHSGPVFHFIPYC